MLGLPHPGPHVASSKVLTRVIRSVCGGQAVDSRHLDDALATLGNVVELNAMTASVRLDGVYYYVCK